MGRNRTEEKRNRRQRKREQMERTKTVALKVTSILELVMLIADKLPAHDVKTIVSFKLVNKELHQAASHLLDRKKLGPFPVSIWLENIIPRLDYFALKKFQRVSKMSHSTSKSNPQALFISQQSTKTLSKSVQSRRPTQNLHPFLKAQLSSKLKQDLPYDDRFFEFGSISYHYPWTIAENASNPPAYRLDFQPILLECRQKSSDEHHFNRTEGLSVKGTGPGGLITIQDALKAFTKVFGKMRTLRELNKRSFLDSPLSLSLALF